MSHVISFANMKGGVGKTTLCVNLAYQFFLQGYDVLIIDNDPQFNATSSLVKPKVYIEKYIKTDELKTIYDIYEKPPRGGRQKRPKVDAENCIERIWYKTDGSKETLSLVASRIELNETLRSPAHKEYLLDKFIKRHATKFDYIFIDCPPTPSVLTYSAFAASDFVLIPVTPSYFATLGLPQFLGTLGDFKENLHDDHDVQALGAIFTNVERQMTPSTRTAMKLVRSALDDIEEDVPVFDSKLSHLKVLENTLWAARPVQQLSGRGMRGKSLAMSELSSILSEVVLRISELEDDIDE